MVGHTVLTSHIKIGIVNIAPKSVVSFKFYNHIRNNQGSTDCLWKTNNIVLTYKNEKDKVIIVPIKREDYRDYRKNHYIENQ